MRSIYSNCIRIVISSLFCHHYWLWTNFTHSSAVFLLTLNKFHTLFLVFYCYSEQNPSTALFSFLLTFNKFHTLFDCHYCWLWTNFTHYSSVFIVDFEQISHIVYSVFIVKPEQIRHIVLVSLLLTYFTLYCSIWTYFLHI